MPEFQRQHHRATSQLQPNAGKAADANVSAEQRYFNMYDVHETSYHFFSQRIDLHLCDDAGGELNLGTRERERDCLVADVFVRCLEGRSCYPELKDGGALQISIQGFQVDYYPFHLAASGRAHWPK